MLGISYRSQTLLETVVSDLLTDCRLIRRGTLSGRSGERLERAIRGRSAGQARLDLAAKLGVVAADLREEPSYRVCYWLERSTVAGSTRVADTAGM